MDPETAIMPLSRPRRLRRTPAMRELVRETRLSPSQLIAPIFVNEAIDVPSPIASLPGQLHETVASSVISVGDVLGAGCKAVILFGLPSTKDSSGSQAWSDEAIVQRAIRAIKDKHGDDAVVIADCCLCEFTDHGHCGYLRADGTVDNDSTLALYAQTAVSQARAGADVIAPSGMMDGQVGAIRQALDDAGFTETAILAYAAKQASAMYGPFRGAAKSAPQFGDRLGYQMDYANAREAMREVELDIEEGADMVMIKPALTALDLISEAAGLSGVPVAAYSVSGEYAMVKHAAAAGAFDERRAAMEVLTAITRAGADMIITYYAREAARWLQEQ